MESVNALAALAAGLLSFLSPCVLPIVPAYLGRLATLGVGASRLRHAALFSLGFGTLFVALGISAGYAGGAAGRLLPLLQVPVGLAVALGGLHLAGLVRIPLLDRMRAPTTVSRSGGIGSFLLGSAFAVAWTPCVGIVLGAILGLAASGSNPLGAALLLALYSLGLAVPFMVLALLADLRPRALAPLLIRLRAGSRAAGVVGGLLVALIGLLIATGGLTLLSRLLPGLPAL